VFNGEGRIIKTLVDADMQAGNYRVDFENEDYPTGVYYVRLQNRSVQQVKHMVLVK
jgi:5-hydroxyisourate hydrolase-like protein (transthyretin family)